MITSLTESEHVAIDIFAGGGGLTLGLSQAGFDVKVGIDIDPNCAETLRKNNGNMRVMLENIRSLKPSDVIKQAGIGRNDLTLLAGGPPCQGFSVSNKRNRCLENPVNSLYLEFFRFVKELSPKMFLLENVEGLCTLGGGIILQDILKRGRKAGYSVNYTIIRADSLGVPQKRKRVIFIGCRKGDVQIPLTKTETICTVKDAIDDLPILENGNSIDVREYSRNSSLSVYEKKMRENNGKRVSNNLLTKNGKLVMERYLHIRQGGNWRDIPNYLMRNYKSTENCHRWMYYRLKWNEPSIAIGNFRKNMLIHPEQHRGLSIREAARLQSFPDNYIFFGKLASQQQQIANAVPPFVAKWIGINLIKIMGD